MTQPHHSVQLKLTTLADRQCTVSFEPKGAQAVLPAGEVFAVEISGPGDGIVEVSFAKDGLIIVAVANPGSGFHHGACFATQGCACMRAAGRRLRCFRPNVASGLWRRACLLQSEGW